MKSILGIFLSLFATLFAEARIGETPQQCIERYGEVIDVNKETQMLGFHKSGLVIVVFFFEGKADGMSYSKSEEDLLGMHSPLSRNEIQFLLKSNAGDSEWGNKKYTGSGEQWQTKDGKLIASYDELSKHRQLIIMTKEFVERAALKKRNEERGNFEGL